MTKNPEKNRGKQETARNDKGQFPPGVSGNPNGRPIGAVSGRKKLLAELDDLLGDEETLTLFREDLKKKMQDNPLAFFMKVVVPLMPKEFIVETKGGLLIGDPSKMTEKQLEDIANRDGDNK